METLRAKFNQFKIPIIAFVLILIVCIIGYYLSHDKRVDSKIKYISQILKNKKSYALDFCSEKYRYYPLLDYHICSSANTIVSNLTKYDHYSAKMIEVAVAYGARFIELEIHNKDLLTETEPIISIGTERGKWKKGLNILTLDEVFSVIKKKAFNEELIPNYTDPFFIFFNLKTDGNIGTLNRLHTKIMEYFGSRLLDRRYNYQKLDIANTSVCDLVDKVVIFSSDGYEGSNFEKIINLSTNHPKLTRISFSELDKNEKFNLNKPNVFIKNKDVQFLNGYLDKYDYININDYKIDLKEMGVKAGQLIKIDGAENPLNNSQSNNDLFKIKQVTRNKILLKLDEGRKLEPEKSGNEISLRIYNDVKESLNIEKLTKDGLFIVVPDTDLFASNFAAKTAWFSGAQFVALNFHNPDDYLLKYLNFFDNASIKLKIPGIRKGKNKPQETNIDLNAKYPAPAIENVYDIEPSFFTKFLDKDVQITSGKDNSLKLVKQNGDDKDLRISPNFDMGNSTFFIQSGNNERLNSFSINIPGTRDYLGIKKGSNNFLTVFKKPLPLDDSSTDLQVKEMEDFKESTSFLPIKPRCMEEGYITPGIVFNEKKDGIIEEELSYLSTDPSFNPKEKLYTKNSKQAILVAEFSHSGNVSYIVRPVTEKGFYSAGDVLINSEMAQDQGYVLSGDFVEYSSGFKTFGGAVEHPVDYELIWKGLSDTSKKDEYSIWKPVAPFGYTCPGYIVNKRNLKPPKNKIMCIKTEFLQTNTMPPPGRRLLYELMWNNGSYAKENKKKGLTLWVPNNYDSERTFQYFVPFELFDNPLYNTRETENINLIERNRVSNISEIQNVITEYEYEYTAPNDFDYPQYILAESTSYTLDKVILKQVVSGKVEKLNSCFKFSNVFSEEPSNDLDMNLLNNMGKISDDIGRIKNYARNEFGGKMCLGLDNSYWSKIYENRFASVEDYQDELGDPEKNKIFIQKCGDEKHFGTNFVYNNYDKTIRLGGNTDFCLTTPYQGDNPIIDKQLYLKQCNTNQPGQEYVLKENGNIQTYNGVEKEGCIFANANNIVKLAPCSERLRKKFRFDSLPATFCLGQGKQVFLLYKSPRKRNMKAKFSVIPQVVDNPLDELIDYNFFHVYIRGEILDYKDDEHFKIKLGVTENETDGINFQIINTDGNDYKITKERIGEKTEFNTIIRKDSPSIILDPTPNPLVNGDVKLNVSSNVLCKNGQLVSDQVVIPESICKFKAKVVRDVGENQYQVVFSINGTEYDKQNKNHFRPRMVSAETFKTNEITMIQKAPICK